MGKIKLLYPNEKPLYDAGGLWTLEEHLAADYRPSIGMARAYRLAEEIRQWEKKPESIIFYTPGTELTITI